MPKWRKKGEFQITKSQKPNKIICSSHAVYYYNDNFKVCVNGTTFGEGFISALNLYVREDGAIKITIDDIKLKFRNVDGFYKEPNWYWVSTSYINDREDLRKLLNKIDEVESIEEIKEEIFLALGIKKSEEIVHQELLKLASEKQIDLALINAKTAQTDGYQHAVWLLAEYLSKEFPQQAYDAYKAIPCENPHFKEAANKIVHLIYETLDAAAHKQFNLSAQEKLAYKEELLTYALNGGLALQKIVDFTYYELCGGVGLVPDINNVKGDAQTLIASAKIIRNLRDQLKLENKKPTFFAHSTDKEKEQPEEKMSERRPRSKSF